MSETLAAENEVKSYRGSSIEELLPQIRTDLGPEAVILRQREGLVGGVGGFFQRRCVEVEARAGGPGIDVYDEQPEAPADEPEPRPEERPAEEPAAAAVPPPLRNDGATRDGLASPAMRRVVSQAEPFAELLEEMGEADAEEPGAPEREPEPEPQAAEAAAPRKGRALQEGLAAAGLGADLAAEIVGSVLASSLPFANPRRLRTLVRDELALRIPVAPAAAPGPRTLALVGPAGAGKSAAAAAICRAHAAAGAAVTCVALAPDGGGTALREMLAGADVRLVVVEDPAELTRTPVLRPEPGAQALCVIDTPPAWSGAPALRPLARALKALAPDEVHAVMRAGTAAAAGDELVDGLAKLGPNRLLATGLGETGHLGSIATVAIRRSLPLGYLSEGPAEIGPADPRALASRITP